MDLKKALKDGKDWIIFGGGAGLIIVVLIGIGYFKSDLNYIKKEISKLDENYEKKVCPPLASLPVIKVKINDEIIPNINSIRDHLKVKAPNIEKLQSQVLYLQKELNTKNMQIEILQADLQITKSQSASGLAAAWKALDTEAVKVHDLRGKLSGVSSALNAIKTDFRYISEKPQSLPTLQEQVFEKLQNSQNVLTHADSELQKTSENIEAISKKLTESKPGWTPVYGPTPPPSTPPTQGGTKGRGTIIDKKILPPPK